MRYLRVCSLTVYRNFADELLRAGHHARAALLLLQSLKMLGFETAQRPKPLSKTGGSSGQSLIKFAERHVRRHSGVLSALGGGGGGGGGSSHHSHSSKGGGASRAKRLQFTNPTATLTRIRESHAHLVQPLAENACLLARAHHAAGMLGLARDAAALAVQAAPSANNELVQLTRAVAAFVAVTPSSAVDSAPPRVRALSTAVRALQASSQAQWGEAAVAYSHCARRNYHFFADL